MTAPWWMPFEEAAHNADPQSDQPLTELTLALDAATWYCGREAVDDRTS